jgi:hypothetical protein
VTKGELYGEEDDMGDYLGKVILWIKTPKWLLLVYYHYVYLVGVEDKKKSSKKDPTLCSICLKGRLIRVHAAHCQGVCNALVHKACLKLQMDKKPKGKCQSEACSEGLSEQ